MSGTNGRTAGMRRGRLLPVTRRHRLLHAVAFAAAMAFAPDMAAAQGVPPTKADSLQAALRRAQRLVNDGQGAEGRKLVDSVLEAAEPRSREEAEALFFRATLAESWDAAQRDYLRLMLEHDQSPRAGDAMLRLAQGELARGDRDAAIRYLERLAREAPESPARAEGALWHGRLLVERGSRDAGCGVLREGRGRVATTALELVNQYEYLLRGCPEPSGSGGASGAAAAATPAVTPSTGPPARDTVRDTARGAARETPAPTAAPSTPSTPSRDSAARPTPVRGAPLWSVQVAALRTREEADALVTKLRARGYDARVDGTEPLFRVRFGKFPTRAAAAAALDRYRTREKGSAFLVEVPRG